MTVLLAGLLQASVAFGADLSADSRFDPPAERSWFCGLDLQLCLNPATPRPVAGATDLFWTRRPEQPEYNAIQRLAGAIADRMDAGSLGPLLLKFKVILE